MSIKITEKAAKEMQRVITETEAEIRVLRVSVVGGGCSGFQYGLKFDKQFDENVDNISEQYGIKVAIDKKSALFLEGTTIDYHDGLEARGFVFNNPNATRSCGCGSSFSV